jgi:hypothetical protein
MNTNQNARRSNKQGRPNNRPNNRNRNQNGRSQRNSPARKNQSQPMNATRQIDSNGPEGKIRGNVKQLYEQYKSLAHDSRTKDRTSSEAYGQFAHHYYTIYAEIAAAEAAQQVIRDQEKERLQIEAAERQENIDSDNNKDTDIIEILHSSLESDEDNTNSKLQQSDLSDVSFLKSGSGKPSKDKTHKKPIARKKAAHKPQTDLFVLAKDKPTEEIKEEVKLEKPKRKPRVKKTTPESE